MSYESLNDELMTCADSGCFKRVVSLIHSGADIHYNDDCAFRWSARNGHLNIARLLLDYGSDIHSMYDYALRFSAEYGHLPVVECLIERGASLHALDDYSFKRASHNGFSSVTNYLFHLKPDYFTSLIMSAPALSDNASLIAMASHHRLSEKGIKYKSRVML